MKKTVIAGLMVAVLVAAFGSAQVVFAQTPDTDPENPGVTGGRGTGLRTYANPVGRMGNTEVEGQGLLEEGQIAYAVLELGLSAEEVQARMHSGETLEDIAASMGEADPVAFAEAARDYARQQLLASGLDIPGWYGGKGATGQGGRTNAQSSLTGDEVASLGQQGAGGGRWNK